MRTKPQLPLDQHQDLGQDLARIRDELLDHALTLAGAYPRTGPNSVPYRELTAAYEAVDRARNALDSTLFREHPDAADPGIYYPAQRRHREAACTAEGTIEINGESIAVICNSQPHDGPDHHDVVQGDWTSPAPDSRRE